MDGYGLINDEQFADDLPLAGPEQSYTVPDRQHNMRGQQQHLAVCYVCVRENRPKARIEGLFPSDER